LLQKSLILETAMPYLRAFISSFVLALRRLLAWCLAIAAIVTPLVYERHLERTDADRFDLAAANSAAVALDRWGRDGRMHVTDWGGHPALDLNVPLSDWETLLPAERQALHRRLSGAVIRGTPVDHYVIREETGVILQRGVARSAP
jgi:hypothetical protein